MTNFLEERLGPILFRKNITPMELEDKLTNFTSLVAPAVIKQPFHRTAVTISIAFDSMFHNLIVSWVKTQVFCKAKYNTVTQNNVKLDPC